MSRPGGAARRSGDPRKGAVQTGRRDTGTRPWAVVVALVTSAALVALAFVAFRPADGMPDQARGHAEVACNLTSKAEEAARVDTGARYAAAVLLLDKAMIESARAAQSDSELAELDQTVQAVHAAGHGGNPSRWRAALDTALTACRATLG